MALRSKPISITAVRNRNVSISYRVMGTTRPKGRQRKEHCMNLEDSESTQAVWEHERMQTAASLRRKSRGSHAERGWTSSGAEARSVSLAATRDVKDVLSVRTDP